MQYRTLGRTRLKVSEVSFGAWAIGGGWGPQEDSESLEALETALDAGVNLIDTAAGYGNGKSERLIGSVLERRNVADDIYVATKTPPTPGPWPPTPYCDQDERYPAEYLRTSVEERLRNLGVDRIDILQLHTWTRAWNRVPRALDTLKKLQQEGKIGFIGISTPEHDQNALIGLMRQGYLDVIQVIYNIFEQEPAAELLPTAEAHNVGVIVRVAFDEGILTGKYGEGHRFPEGDFRRRYFSGDRLKRAVGRVNAIRETLDGTGWDLPRAALKFVLAHPAVSTVITGIRNTSQAKMNTAVSDESDLPAELLEKLRECLWRRGFWYDGK
jgi:aryl-alcohol dehydrogenase-like predicted oxidoreductase